MAESDLNERARLRAEEFVPLTARALLRDRKASVPRALRCPGSVLYCDLAGFSRMGAEAVARSERGAEALQKVINAIFTQVSDVISAHGGAVLYYAGDAVAAHWPAEPDAAASVRAAAACGLEVQKTLPLLSGERARIEMRAGVSFGDLWLLDLDASEGRQLLFCGPALETIEGLSLAREGVRLTAAAADAIGEDPDGTVVRGIDAPALSAPPSAGLDADDWLRAHQRAGLALGPDWVAEFRQVSVLFLRVSGFRFRGRADLRGASSTLEAIARHVEAEGGALLQICYDDKGLVALAAWGLTTSVWEDGAERAVRTALALAGTEDHVAAAVTTGKAFVGLTGALPYLQHVVVGDVVNRAAAMCVAAAAPVTLDALTRDRVARRYETREVAPLTLKGQDEPAPVHVVTRERLEGLIHAGDMIGRQSEKDRVEAAVARLASGAAADLCITGAAGLGKSRLAAWFVERLDAEGVPHLAVQSDGIRRAIGYAPFVPLVSALLKLDDEAGADGCRAALLATLDDVRGDELPLLSPLLPVDLPETDQSAAMSGPGRAERTRELAAELLARLMSGRRTVLIVEDAHWLDSASWQLLAELTRHAPVSVCLVTRAIGPDDVPTEARRFLDPRQVETLTLEPLNAEDGGTLAARSLGARAAAPQLAELLHRQAAGHPLFTVSLAQALAARGLVTVHGGYAHLKLGETGMAHLKIPTDAAGAVLEQISRLAPSEQLTIRTAAVLGRSFDAEALAALHPSADAADVSADLDRIAATGLFEREDAGRWRFHHAIIADAAYQSLVTEQARTLHAAAAARIAAEAGTAPDQSRLALMAHHAERAGDRTAALEHLSAAADGAKRAYANLEVVDFLTRALALSREAGPSVEALTLARWRYDIAYALRALGQYQRAEDFLKLCIADLDRAPPETGGQAARALVGGYAAFRLRPHRAERPAAERAPIILAADATMMLSEIHYELNKIPFALAEILRGATLARAAGGDSATLAKLYIGLSLISTALPWALDGDDLQRRALDIADRLDDPATEGWVYMVSGNYETGKGGWTTGEAHFRHAMAVAEACGERKTQETATSTLANLKRLEGRFAEAKGWSDVTLAASRDRGIVHGIIWSHNGRARDLLCMSDWEAMREDVDAMARLFDDPANALDANDNNRLVFNYTRAALALEDGRDDDAQDALDTALAIVSRTTRPQVYMTQNAPFYCDLLWALHGRGMSRADLLERLAIVCRSAARIGRQYRAGVPMAALAAGDDHWWRGREAKARKAWQAAVHAAEARGMSYTAANALDRLARTGSCDASIARDNHLRRLDISLPRLWRLAV